LFINGLSNEFEIVFFVKLVAVQLFNKMKQHKINSFL
jgi:hypothetical protein